MAAVADIHMHTDGDTDDPTTSENVADEYARCITEALTLRDRAWFAELLTSKLGATQQQIARSFGVSQATISRDLAWRRRIRAEAERLGVAS